MTTIRWQAGLRGGVVAACLLLLPVAAYAELAYTTEAVNVRAGPDRQYPQVAWLPGGTQVNVVGCVEGYRWCDVIVGPNRGWVYAKFLSYPYQNQPTIILEGGPLLGLPLITFGIASYWDNYYRGRPWYGNRSYWYNRPYAPPPAWRPPPNYRPPSNYRPPPNYRPPSNYQPQPDYRPPSSRPIDGRPPPSAGRPDGGRPSSERPPGNQPEGGPPPTGRPSSDRPPGNQPEGGAPPRGRPAPYSQQ